MEMLTLALLVTCVSIVHGKFEAVVNSPGLTDAQRQMIVEKHNELRSKMFARNMMKMEYNMDLEQTAQKAANLCIFAHSPDTNNYRPKYLNPPTGHIGENIYVDPHPSFDVDAPVTVWWNEIHDYTFATGTCDQGKMCGHYTQVVWAYSSKVGCAVSKCDSIDQWENKAGLLMFCQYAPGGNVEGMAPFEEGEACTNCYDSKLYCDAGLCSHTAPGAPVAATPVALVTGDQVCQAREAPDSYMCLPHSYYNGAAPGGDAVCQEISCSTSRMSAFCCKTASNDGLPCGVGKMCQDGKCANDASGQTSSLKSGCLYGDMKKIRWDGVLQTCADMIANPDYGAYHCHNDVFRAMCCGTCEKLSNPNKPDCLYGSHNSCASVPMPLLVCYDATMRDLCCGTDCSSVG